MKSEAVDLEVKSRNGQDLLFMSHVYVVKDIPVKAPCVKVERYRHLQNLPLARGPVEVEILIGQDNAEALIPLEVSKGKTGEPFAMRTMLGWTVNGPAGEVTNKEVISHFITTLQPSVGNTMDTVWNAENEDLSDDKLGLSANDEKVMKLWDETCTSVGGHYELPIPWRQGKEFPNNLESVLPRLHNLKRSLQRKGLYARYDDEVEKLLFKGYAERVPQDQLADRNRTWYIPHQPVITDKKPGKLRLVFDCAAKYRGESLNDKALQGPDLNNKLSHVILRFREHPYAFTADVEAMYSQVKVPINDRDSLRFIWYNMNGGIQHYRMTSHLFGGVWCASAATYALRRAADGDVSRRVKDTINSAFYVDDCLKSVDTKDEAEEIIRETRNTLAMAGFRLTKFVANDDELLFNVPVEDIAEKMCFVDKISDGRALGIQWDVRSDNFYFDVIENQHAQITKRTVLRCVVLV